MNDYLPTEGFTGYFTKEYREMMIMRRKEDRLSYSQLGNLLQVSWLTIRNWEKGISRKCQPSKITAVRNYLSGRLGLWHDSRHFQGTGMKTMQRHNSYVAHKAEMLDKICKIYEICSQSQGLCHELVTEIMRLSSDAISAYAGMEA